MANETGGIFRDIDFEAPGRQVSSLRLGHSDDKNAYGIIPIPITVPAGGAGPTVLLTAGNHRDEYEGQIILRKLIVRGSTMSSGFPATRGRDGALLRGGARRGANALLRRIN